MINSTDMADLIADALVSAGLLDKKDFEKAASIVAEEIVAQNAVDGIMEPYPLRWIDGYWKEVQHILVKSYDKTQLEAETLCRAIYKSYEANNLGNEVYHESAEHEAEALSKWTHQEALEILAEPDKKYRSIDDIG